MRHQKYHIHTSESPSDIQMAESGSPDVSPGELWGTEQLHSAYWFPVTLASYGTLQK